MCLLAANARHGCQRDKICVCIAKIEIRSHIRRFRCEEDLLAAKRSESSSSGKCHAAGLPEPLARAAQAHSGILTWQALSLLDPQAFSKLRDKVLTIEAMKSICFAGRS